MIIIRDKITEPRNKGHRELPVLPDQLLVFLIIPTLKILLILQATKDTISELLNGCQNDLQAVLHHLQCKLNHFLT